MINSIIKNIENLKVEMINSTVKLIQIPSVSDNSNEVKRALEYCIDLAKSLGFNSKVVNDGQIGIIEYGDGEETLGILAHVDVVPTGNINNWLSDPFSGDVIDNKIYGRGAIDDKGPLISSIYALKSVVESFTNFNKKVQIIIGTQEEVEWTDMYSYVKSNKLPDYGFTPDGEFPVCNIEKGFGDLKFNFPLKRDGKDFKIISIHSGVSENTIPDNATAKLKKGDEIIQIISKGKSVHSSMPQKGENALTSLLNELRKYDLGSDNETIALLFKVASDSDCSSFDLKSNDEYFNGEYVHLNISSMTMASTVDDYLIVNLNFRHTYPTTCGDLKKKVVSYLSIFNGKLVSCSCEEPIFISKDKKFLHVFNESYERQSGLKGEFSLAHGGSYAKAMPNIVSWGPIFPGEEDLCHEENEFIDINSMLIMTKIFADTIYQIVSNQQSYK